MDPAQIVNQLGGGISFTKLFLRYESLMITSASWVLIQAIKKSRLGLSSHKLFVRFEPMWPILLSVLMAFFPRFRLGSWDETLLYGIVLGALTGFGTKVLKQTILGQDSRLMEPAEIAAPLELPAAPGAPARPSRPRLREKIKHFIT